MKLKEWKAFLDSIPDNGYNRELDYAKFRDCPTMSGEDVDAKECFVTIDGQLVYVVHADAKKGLIDVIEKDYFGAPIADENGDWQTEQIYGDVKIVKYKSNP